MKAPLSKSGIPERVSRVRISPFPHLARFIERPEKLRRTMGIDLSPLVKWSNDNSGFLSIILFLLTILFSWTTGLLGWLVKFFKKPVNLAPGIHAGGDIRAGGDIIVGNNNTRVNLQEKTRGISAELAASIKDELRKYPSQTFNIRLMSGDYEADTFAKNLKRVLVESGWRNNQFLYELSGSRAPGLILGVSGQPTDAEIVLLNLLTRGGVGVIGNKYSDIQELTLVIGPNPSRYSDS